MRNNNTQGGPQIDTNDPTTKKVNKYYNNTQDGPKNDTNDLTSEKVSPY